MYATQVRPGSIHSGLLGGLVWIDPKLTRFELHPGLEEPTGNWATPAKVPEDVRLTLIAAFNGGFRVKDSKGGFFLEGKTPIPLRVGAASFVITNDGAATVGQWGRDVTMQPNVVAVRPEPRSHRRWWSTGRRSRQQRQRQVGSHLRQQGAGLGALALAELMTRAGCQRAMELDINEVWTNFNFYGAQTPGDPASVVGTKLLPEQHKPASRYLNDDSRDFIAVFNRNP